MARFRAVSLFTGAGGLDYGLEAAGFATQVALEMDPDCCLTLKANRAWPVIEKDIHKTKSQELLDAAGLLPHTVDLLHGGPACQPFSKSAFWASSGTRGLEDSRGETLHAFMRCVRDILPEAFLLENVHGIRYTGNEAGFRLLERLTAEINSEAGTNYTLSWKVLNAADYGVPQLRRRFFLVAHRDGKVFIFPDPTHQPRPTGSVAPYVSSWDAIGMVEPSDRDDLRLTGRWADLLPSVPEGHNYLWHTRRNGGLPLFGWRTRYWSFLLKLAKDLPSWTIQAQPGPATGPFHWENRRLSRTEMGHLQTIPADITIEGTLRSAQQQIGNAVPSLLAEVLGREIAAQFFDARRKGPLKLAVPVQDGVPMREPVAAVPEKYLGLVGNHPDHRGTGLGPLPRQQT